MSKRVIVYGTASERALVRTIEELRRENAALRKDKERLDWLLSDEGKRWLFEDMRLGFQTDRRDIDSIRTEVQS